MSPSPIPILIPIQIPAAAAAPALAPALATKGAVSAISLTYKHLHTRTCMYVHVCKCLGVSLYKYSHNRICANHTYVHAPLCAYTAHSHITCSNFSRKFITFRNYSTFVWHTTPRWLPLCRCCCCFCCCGRCLCLCSPVLVCTCSRSRLPIGLHLQLRFLHMPLTYTHSHAQIHQHIHIFLYERVRDFRLL